MPLVASADVIVEQFRPGVMDRLGLGYEAVSRGESAHHLLRDHGLRPVRTAREHRGARSQLLPPRPACSRSPPARTARRCRPPRSSPTSAAAATRRWSTSCWRCASASGPAAAASSTSPWPTTCSRSCTGRWGTASPRGRWPAARQGARHRRQPPLQRLPHARRPVHRRRAAGRAVLADLLRRDRAARRRARRRARSRSHDPGRGGAHPREDGGRMARRVRRQGPVLQRGGFDTRTRSPIRISAARGLFEGKLTAGGKTITALPMPIAPQFRAGGPPAIRRWARRTRCSTLRARR